jgi:hypothetical protein
MSLTGEDPAFRICADKISVPHASISEFSWPVKAETDCPDGRGRVEERPPGGEELPFESPQVRIIRHVDPIGRHVDPIGPRRVIRRP